MRQTTNDEPLSTSGVMRSGAVAIGVAAYLDLTGRSGDPRKAGHPTTRAIDGTRASEFTTDSRMQTLRKLIDRLIVERPSADWHETLSAEDRDHGKSPKWMPFENPTTPFQHRLDHVRERAARIGDRPDLEATANAVVCGALSMALGFGDIESTESDIDAEVDQILMALGQGLDLAEAIAHVWEQSSSSLFFRMQGRFSIGHDVDDLGGSFASDSSHTSSATQGSSRFGCVQADITVDRHGNLVLQHTIFGRAVPFMPVHDSSPRWSSVAAQLLDADIRCNIEVKSTVTESSLVHFLAKENEAGRLDRYCVSAPFHGRVLRRLRLRFPGLATNDSLVEGGLIGRPLSLRPTVRRTASTGCQIPRQLDIGGWATRASLQRAKFPQLYIVNDAASMERADRRGATAIITDHLWAADWPRQP